MKNGMGMKDKATGDSLVLTPNEVARLLRIGRSTCYEGIRQGVIPSLRIGRRILVPKGALLKMLEQAAGNSRHP